MHNRIAIETYDLKFSAKLFGNPLHQRFRFPFQFQFPFQIERTCWLNTRNILNKKKAQLKHFKHLLSTTFRRNMGFFYQLSNGNSFIFPFVFFPCRFFFAISCIKSCLLILLKFEQENQIKRTITICEPSLLAQQWIFMFRKFHILQFILL